uniref:Choline/carnitine acyltransferase domain-containing protein n=1 Tax=Arcella intermedia TaxID=1963864 RepID=A0A6B2L062_9EUKA|eukprot:TRINITY_DN600_c0_g1_i1.p1 TRINITY_DN600_c0_g1~~TRINITY_DN600_c0_g1_i1.p1  ORF type:complete len:598 (+),score=151.87 TRINITY_DN600_c0_g1_i1:105-1898(+)
MAEGRKTFYYEDRLPRLPVPEPEVTFKKYLETIKPLCDSLEDYLRNERLIQDFAKNLAPKLQQRLIQRDKLEKDSWLDRWWLQYAYMDYRDPVPINVSYAITFKDHPNKNIHYLERAAGLLQNVLVNKEELQQERFPADVVQGVPNCLSVWKTVWNSCRIPHPTTDTTALFSDQEATNFVVTLDGQFYSFPAFYSNGKPLSRSDILKQLKRVCDSNARGRKYPNIGIFTTENRTTWATIRSKMLQSPTNLQSLREIERSILVLCLDHHAPSTFEEFTQQVLWGGVQDRENRFYDKPLQFIVTPNSMAAINGEHSTMDGQPVGLILDWILQREQDGKIDHYERVEEELVEPAHLEFQLTEELNGDLRKAQHNFRALVENTNQTVFHYKGFGKHHCSKVLKASPDATVQIALQMAYYQQQGKFCGVYESVSMRHYKKGRTETGRCLTSASKDFVVGFFDDKLSVESKKQLFYKAVDAHVKYLNEAKKGKGIDRHFLAFKLLMQESGETHPLFSDPVFINSSTWRLSTSHLGFPNVNSIGFGPVAPDGYGVCYAVKKEEIRVHLTNWKDCSTANVQQFKQLLTNSLDQINHLLTTPNSKL